MHTTAYLVSAHGFLALHYARCGETKFATWTGDFRGKASGTEAMKQDMCKGAHEG
jgi:hypothetical protein